MEDWWCTDDEKRYLRSEEATRFFNMSSEDIDYSLRDPEFAYRLVQMVEEKARRSGIELSTISENVHRALFRAFGAQLFESLGVVRRQNPKWDPLHEKKT